MIFGIPATLILLAVLCDLSAEPRINRCLCEQAGEPYIPEEADE
jgi:hypothetical protein